MIQLETSDIADQKSAHNHRYSNRGGKQLSEKENLVLMDLSPNGKEKPKKKNIYELYD